MAQTANLKSQAPAYNTSTAPEDRRVPWSVMGSPLNTSYGTATEALAANGLDYDVEVRHLYSAKHDAEGLIVDGSLLGAPSLRTIVRPMPDGSEKVLAASGTRFTPIQNRDAFAVNDYLAAEFAAPVTGAVDFRGGGATLLVNTLPASIDLRLPGGGVERTSLYLLTKNAHDASAALTYALTSVRVACTNVLPAALRNAKRMWKISHTPNAQGRVGLATQAIIASLSYRDEFQAAAQAMLDTRMVDREFAKIVEGMYPVSEAKRETVAGRNALEIQASIKALYHSSTTLEGIRGTRWAGYNAITEFLDWERPVRGGEVARAEGALEGHYAKMKDRAWATFAMV